MNLFKKRINILVCGTLSSGSSAMINLLKEYDNIGHFSSEFDHFRAPGLVADQLTAKSNIDFPNKIDQLFQFKTSFKRLVFRSSILKIFLICFSRKYWSIDFNSNFLNNLKFKLLEFNKLYLLKQLNKILKSNISFEAKLYHSNFWIQRIGDIFSNVKDYILFDQPILSSTDIKTWTSVFNPFKLIIIYRDPMDQLADIIKRETLFVPYGAPYMTMAGDNLEAIYGRNRSGAIKFHADAIKSRLKWIDHLEKVINQDRILLLDFEGLVSNYDSYRSTLEDFIGGIKGHQKFRNKYFSPSKSYANIGIYKKYLNDEDMKELTDLEHWYTEKQRTRTNLFLNMSVKNITPFHK